MYDSAVHRRYGGAARERSIWKVDDPARLEGEPIEGDVGPVARVHVVIPALDEAATIGGVVAAVPPGFVSSVTVVDNGSSDDTASVARDAGASVVLEPQRGYGAACLAGLRALPPRDASRPDEVVVFLDGDGSEPADLIPAVVEPILDGEADLVVAVRRPTERGALTPTQRVGNALAAFWLRARFGLPASDLGPFRAIRRSSLEMLEMSDQGYGWTVEMQIKAARARLRYREVAVPCRRRQGGRSKISGTVRGTVGAAVTILSLLLRHWDAGRLMTGRRHRLACGAFVVLCGLIYGVAALPPGTRPAGYLAIHVLLTGVMVVAWRTAGAASWRWVIAAGMLSRVVLLPAPAFTSVDVARYLWDGRLALTGLDPYLVAPATPALGVLRTEWLPKGVHLHLPTIYPPGALGLFSLAALGGDPATARLLWKTIVTAFAIVTLWSAARTAAESGTRRHLALVALSPLLVLETGVGGHLDAVATCAVAVALWLASRRDDALAGVALGLGAVIKILPGAAALPLAARARSRGRPLVACAAVVVAVYGVTLALGFLPIGSLAVPFREWSFGSPIWTALDMSLGRAAASIVSLALLVGLLALAVALARRGAWVRGAQVALAAPILLSPVVHPWYLMPLVPTLAIAPSAALLAWVTAAPLAYEVLARAELSGEWQPASWPLWMVAASMAIGLVVDAWGSGSAPANDGAPFPVRRADATEPRPRSR
jgi:glycosyltransferase involved in cell wall biosynthesis